MSRLATRWWFATAVFFLAVFAHLDSIGNSMTARMVARLVDRGIL